MGQHLVTYDPWTIDPFPALLCAAIFFEIVETEDIDSNEDAKELCTVL